MKTFLNSLSESNITYNKRKFVWKSHRAVSSFIPVRKSEKKTRDEHLKKSPKLFSWSPVHRSLKSHYGYTTSEIITIPFGDSETFSHFETMK